jgi:hypothetical protein
MELSPPWEAASPLATQEFANILRSSNVYYRVHKSHPLIPIISQISLVHITPSYFCKIHVNITLQPTSVFIVVSLLAFPSKPYMYSSPHACYMPCPSHPPWLYHSNYIWWRVKVMKLLIMQFSPPTISTHVRTLYKHSIILNWKLLPVYALRNRISPRLISE